MKKNLSIIFLLITFSGYAQKDPKALAILNAMSAKYKSMNAYSASFLGEIENPQTKTKNSFKGEVTVKSEKFRLKMDGQEVINDGTTMWTYLQEENEVNISDYEPTEDEVSPSNINTIYKKGYKFVFLEEKKEGGNIYDVIDLIPENKSKQIFKIRIQISRKDKTIKNWKVFERNGNRYNCTVVRLTPESSIQDSYFSFDVEKYKGVEVVDLR